MNLRITKQWTIWMKGRRKRKPNLSVKEFIRAMNVRSTYFSTAMPYPCSSQVERNPGETYGLLSFRRESHRMAKRRTNASAVQHYKRKVFQFAHNKSSIVGSLSIIFANIALKICIHHRIISQLYFIRHHRTYVSNKVYYVFQQLLLVIWNVSQLPRARKIQLILLRMEPMKSKPLTSNAIIIQIQFKCDSFDSPSLLNMNQ